MRLHRPARSWLLLASVALSVLWWLASREAADPKPLPAAAAAAGQATAATAADLSLRDEQTAEDPESTPQRLAATGAGATAGLDCLVLGPDEQPIAGAKVLLSRAAGTQPDHPVLQGLNVPPRDVFSSLPRESYFRLATTDADGRCSCDDLNPGNLRLKAVVGAVAATTCYLAAGERTAVVLQFDRQLAMVSGKVSTNAPEWRLFRGPTAEAVMADGTFQLVCNAGQQSLRIDLAGKICQLDGGVELARQRIVLAAGERLDLGTIEAPAAFLLPRFAEPRCAVSYNAGLELRRIDAEGRPGRALQLPWPLEAEIALPPGRYQAAVDATQVLGAEPIEFQVLPYQRHLIEFAGEPTAVVHLHIRDERGQRLWPPAGSLWLATTHGNLPVQGLTTASDRGSSVQQFGFRGVPLGLANLQSADQLTDSTATFQFFEPVAEQTIDVSIERRNQIVLQVQIRPQLRLRATCSVGREDVQARIQVFAGNREVQGSSRRPSQWQARVPAGEYRVQVTRPTAVQEVYVLVGTEGVDRSIRP